MLCLILALLTRFAPRSRVVLSMFSFLLVAVMAVQVWLGVLLLFDGGRGPLAGFKPASDSDQSAPATLPSVSPMTMAQ